MPAKQNQDKNPQNGKQGTSYLYDYGTSPNTRTAVSQKIRVLTPTYGETAASSQMGVLSSFAPSISRTVDELRGIGFGDQVAELVPSITAAPTASFERALLYLSNLWQATGYAGGVDGPVRSLSQHKWPFDIEQQLVFSSLADWDRGGGPDHAQTAPGAGTFDGGVADITYPNTTQSLDSPNVNPTANPSHTAIITMYEACWFTSWSATFSRDAGMIMESGDVMISDIHDFASAYGEFLATGNDPTLGQLGSIRFSGSNGLGGGQVTDPSGMAGGGTSTNFVNTA